MTSAAWRKRPATPRPSGPWHGIASSSHSRISPRGSFLEDLLAFFFVFVLAHGAGIIGLLEIDQGLALAHSGVMHRGVLLGIAAAAGQHQQAAYGKCGNQNPTQHRQSPHLRNIYAAM